MPFGACAQERFEMDIPADSSLLRQREAPVGDGQGDTGHKARKPNKASKAEKAKAARASRAGLRFTDDPLWYKDAIIYQIHIKSYFDANDDGIGDFAGLIQKLDYITGLGVNTIWLLPFYPSPRR